MSPLFEIEKKYSKYLIDQSKALDQAEEALKTIDWKFCFKKNEITKAILWRMKAYYEIQNKIKIRLNKGVAAAGSDFFVETILFYLKQFLEQEKSFLVSSEQTLKSQKIRPDISIWKGGKLVAIIECKTHFSRMRNEWKAHIQKRIKSLQAKNPRVKIYWVVMTSDGWGPAKKKNCFTLLDHKKSNIDIIKFPKKLEENNLKESIFEYIEPLFMQIKSL